MSQELLEIENAIDLKSNKLTNLETQVMNNTQNTQPNNNINSQQTPMLASHIDPHKSSQFMNNQMAMMSLHSCISNNNNFLKINYLDTRILQLTHQIIIEPNEIRKELILEEVKYMVQHKSRLVLGDVIQKDSYQYNLYRGQFSYQRRYNNNRGRG